MVQSKPVKIICISRHINPFFKKSLIPSILFLCKINDVLEVTAIELFDGLDMPAGVFNDPEVSTIGLNNGPGVSASDLDSP